MLFFSYQREEEEKHHLPPQHRKNENSDEKNIKNYTVSNFQKVPKSTCCQSVNLLVNTVLIKKTYCLNFEIFEVEKQELSIINIKILMYGSKHLNHKVQDKTLLDTEKAP